MTIKKIRVAIVDMPMVATARANPEVVKADLESAQAKLKRMQAKTQTEGRKQRIAATEARIKKLTALLGTLSGDEKPAKTARTKATTPAPSTLPEGTVRSRFGYNKTPAHQSAINNLTRFDSIKVIPASAFKNSEPGFLYEAADALERKLFQEEEAGRDDTEIFGYKQQQAQEIADAIFNKGLDERYSPTKEDIALEKAGQEAAKKPKSAAKTYGKNTAVDKLLDGELVHEKDLAKKSVEFLEELVAKAEKRMENLSAFEKHSKAGKRLTDQYLHAREALHKAQKKSK